MTRPTQLTRRRVLQTTTAAVTTTVLLTGTGTAHDNDDESTYVSIRFPDQEIGGDEITIEHLHTETRILLRIMNSNADHLARETLGPGTYVNHTITLDEKLEESQVLSARAYPSDGGSRLARDDAHAQLERDGREYLSEIEPQLIPANPDAGFNYPYYLYAPARYAEQPSAPVLVEPVNSGEVTDDMNVQLDEGEKTITGGIGREIASELNAPFVVPVFPRPRTDPVDGTHYTHALDDTTMNLTDGSLERIDLQVLNMIENAQQRLLDEDYPVAPGMMLNGFSASGNFVDRFTVLHADKVTSVTAGGLNGMPLLPVDELDGRELPFHVGTADVEAITGDAVDREALNDTPQFLYMGAEDENDTIPYDDAWTDDSLRQLALDVYGEDMVDDRFARSARVYENAGIDATFKVYEGVGHSPREAKQDIVEFHREALLDEQRGDRTTVTRINEDGQEEEDDDESNWVRGVGEDVVEVVTCVGRGVVDAVRSVLPF